jgi:hypothetical protein
MNYSKKRKLLFTVLLLLLSSYGFAQSYSSLEQEALDIINPIYAKVVEGNDTITILKEDTLGIQTLNSLALVGSDTLYIDSTIVYVQNNYFRKFYTLPQYSETTEKIIISPSYWTKVIPAEYTTETAIIKVKEATTRWIKRKCINNIGVTGNPDDCQVWVLVEVPARYETITKTVLKTPAIDKSVEISAEYGNVTKRVVTKKSATLYLEYRTLTYRMDTQIVQTEWRSEHTIDIPAEYIFAVDRIRIPKHFQQKSFNRLARWDISKETTAFEVTKWVKTPTKNHKNDCCYGRNPKNCLRWELKIIPVKYKTVEKLVLSNNTRCGEVPKEPKAVRYYDIPLSILKSPAHQETVVLPDVFVQQIEKVPVLTHPNQQETLHIQAIDIIPIFKKKE